MEQTLQSSWILLSFGKPTACSIPSTTWCRPRWQQKATCQRSVQPWAWSISNTGTTSSHQQRKIKLEQTVPLLRYRIRERQYLFLWRLCSASRSTSAMLNLTGQNGMWASEGLRHACVRHSSERNELQVAKVDVWAHNKEKASKQLGTNSWCRHLHLFVALASGTHLSS